MANFYTDNPDLKLHLQHPLMKKIVALKERDFTEAEKFDYAPIDFDDAMDNYNRVLEIVGDLCGTTIADNAEGVDHDGPTVADGRVTYAPGTQQNLEACRKAGLMGMAKPRLNGSLTIPITNGRLNIGIWQGIYLCEFRNRGRGRRIVATVIG